MRRSLKLALGIAVLTAVAVIALVLSQTSGRNKTSTDSVSDREQQLESLKALPYVAWTETADTSKSGVTIWDRDRAHPGLNLYTNDVNEVYLTDMSGKRVHIWRVPGKKRQCEHAELLDDRTLLVVCTSQSLVRLDWDSNVLWENKTPVHHDVTQLSDGSFLAIFKRKPRQYGSFRVDFDSLIHISMDGKSKGRWSTFENISYLRQFHLPSPLDSPPSEATEIHRQENTRYDYYHMNTVEALPANPLEEKDTRFQQGNLLVCLRNVNLIAVLHRATKQVLWHWGVGELDYPHHPTMLQSGNILVFDNGTHRGYSRVLEVDPLTDRIVWEFKGNPPGSFFSAWRGSNQRLPNGNTLVCDSENGRAFEVDRAGKTVWEFWNPEIRDGKRKRIYRFERVTTTIQER